MRSNKINVIVLIAVLIIFSVLPLYAEVTHPDYHIYTERLLPNEAGTFRHIQFMADNVVDVYALLLKQSIRVRLFSQPFTNQADAEFLNRIASHENFIAAINAGFYTPDFRTAGLHIDRNRTITSIAKDRLLSTCVGINAVGRLFLGDNRKNCLNAFYAVQTGPALIVNDKINSELMSNEKRFPKMQSFFAGNRRTILAKTDDGRTLILVSTPATLIELAHFLKNFPQSMGAKKIKMAVSLDGGSSTGMYIPFLEEPFYFHEQKRVKTFLFFY